MEQYFQTSVSYDKIMDNGAMKKVTEHFVVFAMSFAEAEAITTEEQAPFMSGDFDVKTAKRIKICEIFNRGNGDKYYLVKSNFITLDEHSGTEKRTMCKYLVGADCFQDAVEVFMENMKGTMSDFEITSISETPILEIYSRV